MVLIILVVVVVLHTAISKNVKFFIFSEMGNLEHSLYCGLNVCVTRTMSSLGIICIQLSHCSLSECVRYTLELLLCAEGVCPALQEIMLCNFFYF